MKDSDNIPKLQAYNKWNIFMSPFGANQIYNIFILKELREKIVPNK